MYARALAKTSGTWPRPAEVLRWAQTHLTPWAALAVLSHWNLSGLFSACGMRTCFLHPSPSFLIIHPPLPCAHRACSKPCCTFTPHRRVATIPEMMSVKCHMFQEEKRSPEGTWGIVIIPVPLWRGHGYLAWSHHLLWRQLLPGRVCTRSRRLSCLTSRLPWAAAGTACSSAWLWQARMPMRAGTHILERSVTVYSFSKYLLSVYSEPTVRLDTAGGLRLVREERILYLWITSFGA